MKRIVSILCAFALLFGSALAEEEPVLEQMFLYRVCRNPEIAQQPGFDEADLIWDQPQENADYQAMIFSHAQALNQVQEQNGLRFTAKRGLAVNELAALEWTVENISGESRLLDEGWLEVNGPTGAYNVHSLHGMVLLPGEIRTGLAKMMLPGLSGDTCQFSIRYGEYAIAPEEIPADRTEPIAQWDKDAEELCGDTFAIEMPRNIEKSLFELAKPLEMEWQGSILRLTDAKLSLSGGAFTVLRIFADEQAARAVDPWSWDFDTVESRDETGSRWVQVGGGTSDDEPFRMEDGRYAYRCTKTVDFLNWLPEKLSIVPRSEENGYALDWDAAIELLQ